MVNHNRKNISILSTRRNRLNYLQTKTNLSQKVYIEMMSNYAFNILIIISILSSFGIITTLNPLSDSIYIQGQQEHLSSEHHSSDIDEMASSNTQTNNLTDNTLSPYTTEQNRTIKSLSNTDILSLRSGTGDAYGGLAKPAELNGYPGPRHVLDLTSALNLTQEQHKEIEAVFNKMKNQAIPVGLEIIEVEKKIEDSFANDTITKQDLQMLLDFSSDLYGQLRYVHLSSHLIVMDILTPQQVSIYNEIRGYK